MMDMAANMVAMAVELSGITKTYGGQSALRDLDLSLVRGECLALLGHNGAGKTTILKLMLGLTPPSRGGIRYYDRDGIKVSCNAWRRDMGFLPESVAFHDNLTGSEMLRFYARLKGCAIEECEALIERVGLGDAIGRRIRTYSKGMRQRIGLAQALMGDPAVLLLDEPTTGLDPSLRREFYGFIRHHQSGGGTTLISSHTLSEIEQTANRFVILKRGLVVADGSLDQLRRLAGLPTCIRVSVTPGAAGMVAECLGGRVDFHRVDEQSIELSCSDTGKLEVLRIVTNMEGRVVDVEVLPARLEQLYAHFTDLDDGA